MKGALAHNRLAVWIGRFRIREEQLMCQTPPETGIRGKTQGFLKEGARDASPRLLHSGDRGRRIG